MSKIQEFIDAWNAQIDADILESQTKVDLYLSTRQTAIAQTIPFVLKMPALKYRNGDNAPTIDGFDVTTLGQLMQWTYPHDSYATQLKDEFGNTIDKKRYVTYYSGRDFEDTDDSANVNPKFSENNTDLYTTGYTLGTMSYLSKKYKEGISINGLDTSLYKNYDEFQKFDSLKRLKELGGKKWFGNWMGSIYISISGSRIKVSTLKDKDYEDLFLRFEEELSESYMKGFYIQGSRILKYPDTKLREAVKEAGDNYNANLVSGATSSTTSETTTTDCTITVKDPKSDNDKKITGLIKFVESKGLETLLSSNSTLTGLPNPWTNPSTNIVVPNNTGEITYNTLPKQATRQALIDETLNSLQNILISTYGINVILQTDNSTSNTSLTTDQEIKDVIGTSSVVGTASSSEKILQEFTFNVELQDVFSNSEFGNLFIFGQEDQVLFNEEYDDILSEYSEDTFAGQDEVPFVLPIEDINAFESQLDSGAVPASIISEDDKTPTVPGTINGNIKLIANAARKVGLNSKYAIASMVAIASGESGLKPQAEGHIYSGGPEGGIRIFAMSYDQKVRATRKGITKPQFFSIVYGEYKPERVANRNVSDGGLYYGRGFIQLTGHGNYLRYGNLLKKYFPGENVDIVKNPNLVNDASICAKLVAVYFLDRVKVSPNSSSYFEASLKAVGNDAHGGYAKKRKFYNNFVNTIV